MAIERHRGESETGAITWRASDRSVHVLSSGSADAGLSGEGSPGASAPVALVFDYEAAWITRVQPHGADFSYGLLAFRWYEATRRLGLDLEIVGAGALLSDYRAVLVPTLPYVSDPALPHCAIMRGRS
jgi:beta-galactosidase